MIFVENCNSPVFCPDCGERMSKISFPRESFPSTLKNGTIVTKYLGLAHCSTPKGVEYGRVSNHTLSLETVS